MIAFADASALVKRYLDEEHRELVMSLTDILASSISAVEVSSAIWRRQRLGELHGADAATLASLAQRDLTGGDPQVVVLPPTTPVLLDAGRLTGTAGLRAYDAVQLASAIAMRAVYPDVNTFACFDRELSAAAAAHGFDVLRA